MSSDVLIELDGVGCRYKYRAGLFKFKFYEALRDISFTIKRGETVGIIGRNGAGKSTLLRLIAGIIEPDEGEIRRYGVPSVSLLTLQLGFSQELSGRDNAVLGAMLLGHPRSKVLKRLESIKQFSELGSWFEEPIKSYSTGMLARLGFAVAMEMSPDILLVDEVLGVGDEAFRAKSTAAMKDKMKSGQTVVFVSHQSGIIRELCTSLVWIENGTSKAFGTTDEVLALYHASFNGPA